MASAVQAGLTMGSVRDRLAERLGQEERLLAEVFPTAHLDRESLTVLLSDLTLPEGWSHDSTDVLFVIPGNYPAGCPDNVCVRPDLRLAGGAEPANIMGEHEHAGRRWLQFSWHPDEWRPTADASRGGNLVNYLIGAIARLEEVS